MSTAETMSDTPLVGILVGGRSKRMGRDKADLMLGGRTLLQRTLATVSAANLPAVVLGRTSLRDENWTGIPDREPYGGPLLALATGLEAAQDAHHQHLLLIAVDLPLLSAAVLAWLADFPSNTDTAVIPRVAGRDQFCCARYATALLPTLETAINSGQRSMHEALAQVPTAQPEPSASLVDAFSGVNSPEQLAALIAAHPECEAS